ncbi:hypothetical protein OCU04_008404 [Sclerotinia nivalis]|uniref:SET domain-containing protein n=1 Tax=Sclerotinia nivalis TaxID=352851 RepID=A0A9X0DI18_9HELO|nr:hypothetical protein OCU04_008404 [Sclerotinia nivalis]
MAPSQQLPKNWPSHIPYLTTPTYCATLNPSHLKILRTPTPDAIPIPPSHPKGPSPLVKITPINDPSHPANGQCGLFATRDLKPGTFILQYIGEVHAPTESTDERVRKLVEVHEKSDYDLSLDRDMGIGVDAQGKGNEARFINDFRGVTIGGERARVNVEFKEVWDAGRGERGMGVWVLGEKAGSGKGKGVGKWKGIRKGEEILVSYGRRFWGARKGEGEEEWGESYE